MNDKIRQAHFSEVAGGYDSARDLDEIIINLLAEEISNGPNVPALDLATGTARYPIEIARRFGHRFVGFDANSEMLETGKKNAAEQGLTEKVELIHGNCYDLSPVNGDRIYGVVTMMNALHHFENLSLLAKQVKVVLHEEGTWIIYTRTEDDNQRTIWGECFPEFAAKEKKYLGKSGFSVDRLDDELKKGGMKIVTIKRYDLAREHTLRELLEKVDARHYSTFREYDDNDIATARTGFIGNIHERYPETRDNPHYKIRHVSPMSVVYVKPIT